MVVDAEDDRARRSSGRNEDRSSIRVAGRRDRRCRARQTAAAQSITTEAAMTGGVSTDGVVGRGDAAARLRRRAVRHPVSSPRPRGRETDSRRRTPSAPPIRTAAVLQVIEAYAERFAADARASPASARAGTARRSASRPPAITATPDFCARRSSATTATTRCRTTSSSTASTSSPACRG